MSYKHGKAKLVSWHGYGTRKTRYPAFSSLYPQHSGTDVYYEPSTSLSRRRKWYERQTNRKLRRNKYLVLKGGEYKRIYDLNRNLW